MHLHINACKRKLPNIETIRLMIMIMMVAIKKVVQPTDNETLSPFNSPSSLFLNYLYLQNLTRLYAERKFLLPALV